MYDTKPKWRICRAYFKCLLIDAWLKRFLLMDKLEELYFTFFSSNCFKDAYKGRICDILVDLDWFTDGDSKDLLLLTLTIIQTLFQRLETTHCPYLRIIANDLVEKNLLVDKLLKCLSYKNQHVVFSATKAIVLVLQMLPKQMIKIEWIYSLFNFSCFTQEIEQPWRKLYTMELSRKVFKNSRDAHKNRNKSFQQVENQACHCPHKEDVVYTTVSGSDLVKLFLGSFSLEHILFYYIPFVVRPNGAYSFMKSYQHIGTVEDFVMLQACLKLGDAIHNQENVKRDPITGTKENNLIAFLHCVMEIAKCLHRTPQRDIDVNYSTQPKKDLFSPLSTESTKCHGNMTSESGEVSREKTHPEIEAKEMPVHITNATAKQLSTIIATLAQYLHYLRLPSLIFKKILEVLNQVIVIQSSSLFNLKSDYTKFDKITRSSSISFLSVFECCLLDKIPKYSGFLGFCGTEIKRSGSSCTSERHHECVDVVVLRKASLILVKSSFVVLKMATNQEGSSLLQKLSLSCFSLWCTHLLTSMPDILANTKETSIQNEFQSLLVALFVDQDDELVEVLLLLLLLFQEIQSTVPSDEVPMNVSQQLNPHLLFAAFVESIEFDHSVLLDLLISSETRFLEYFLHYLHLIVGDWTSFIQCLETYKGRSACSELTKMDFSNENLSESDSVLDFSNTELAEGNRGFQVELNLKESELLCHKQEKQGKEGGFVSECSSSRIVMDDVCFLSCRNRCDMFCGRVSEAVCCSERCSQPDILEKVKENQGTVGETAGLKSIVLAYSSSDESDMEIEDGSKNATMPPTGNQLALVNDVDKYKSKSYALSPDITKRTESFDVSFTNSSGFARGMDNTKTKESVNFLSQTTDCNSCESRQERGNKPSAGFVSVVLDRIMTMLIRLRMSVTRLSSGGHFPYTAGPLLALMENVEKFYDGC